MTQLFEIILFFKKKIISFEYLENITSCFYCHCKCQWCHSNLKIYWFLLLHNICKFMHIFDLFTTRKLAIWKVYKRKIKSRHLGGIKTATNSFPPEKKTNTKFRKILHSLSIQYTNLRSFVWCLTHAFNGLCIISYA